MNYSINKVVKLRGFKMIQEFMWSNLYEISRIEDVTMLIAKNNSNLGNKAMILNETSEFILSLLNIRRTKDFIVKEICFKYSGEPKEKIDSDVTRFLFKMIEMKVVEGY